MTEMEEKSFKTQIELYKNINEYDNMIIHTVHDVAARLFDKIVQPKIFMKEGQTNVEFSPEEFMQLKLALIHLSSDEGFNELDESIRERYISPKKEKLKILRMLR